MLLPLSEAIRLCDTYLQHGAYLPTTLQRTELLDEVMEAVCRAGSSCQLQDFFIDAPPRDFHHVVALLQRSQSFLPKFWMKSHPLPAQYRAILLTNPGIVERSFGIIGRGSLRRLLGRCTNMRAPHADAAVSLAPHLRTFCIHDQAADLDMHAVCRGGWPRGSRGCASPSARRACFRTRCGPACLRWSSRGSRCNSSGSTSAGLREAFWSTSDAGPAEGTLAAFTSSPPCIPYHPKARMKLSLLQ
ncbi:hypothetical protein FB451DRAFT_141798 [Mycena latifolia]|nr:hypothetical protein FB451DRAFT_141798 [Mycena latifolia]